MKAILAASILASVASPALAKPVTAKAPAPTPQKVIFDERTVLLDGAALVVEAVDEKQAPVVEKKALEEKKAPAIGLGYGLKQRQAALPTMHTEEFEAKSLTENQVGAIVRERSEDLEYCWLRLPPSKRVVSAAILHLEIEQSGKVASVEVNGDMPAGVGKCISQMASRWAFPEADAPSTVDHGIMLTTASQKVR